MPPTMGGPTEAGQVGPIVKALAVANAAVRKPPDVWRKYMRHFNYRRPPRRHSRSALQAQIRLVRPLTT
jgi:hypothetical protein